MSFLSNLWDVIWFMVTIFVFVAYLMALFSILTDLFRDRNLNGWAKAVWLIFLIFLPFLTALVYLIARGRGMSERAAAQAHRSQEAAESYIRSIASEATPTDEITRAKTLLDDGVITADEFAALKAAAIAKTQ